MPVTKTPIRLVDIRKRFGASTAVDGVSLDIAAGELFFLLGPSGCGKTTLLRMLAGFETPDSGDIFFGDQNVTPHQPKDRNTGLVFQTYALWPHMSVSENVAYGLRVRKLPKAEREARVDKALAMVRMEKFAARRPTQLSGGQQQRVALARAMVIEPRVLLLDEPLSNLDARLREEMREEIRRLHDETGLTMVYVTHDQKEALALANRMAVMSQGKIVQAGPPIDLYHRPRNRFVAEFLGDSNFIPGTVRSATDTGDRCAVETAVGTLMASGPATDSRRSVGTNVVFSVRPQSVRVHPGEPGATGRLAGTLDQVLFQGEVLALQIKLTADVRLKALLLPNGPAAEAFRPGQPVSVEIPPDQGVLLDP